MVISVILAYGILVNVMYNYTLGTGFELNTERQKHDIKIEMMLRVRYLQWMFSVIRIISVNSIFCHGEIIHFKRSNNIINIILR